MKRALLGFAAAAFLHLLILLFGGIFFLDSDASPAQLTVEDVDLVADDVEEKKPDETELEKRDADQVDAPPEKPKEMTQLVEVESEIPNLADATPELAALSLSALESVLGPSTGGGEFGSTVSLASGGRIGGTGAPGSGDAESTSDVFSLADLDQSPRALSQAAPTYPVGLRQRKIEGVVTVVFVVDAQGRVLNPEVERSTDPAFEPPAIEAIRRWKFEPAMRNGKKVSARLRIPIRFSLNS